MRARSASLARTLQEALLPPITPAVPGLDVGAAYRAAGGGTEVVIEEDAAAGPGVLVPRPVRGVTFRWRNIETLRRLAYLAERRTSPATSA